MTGSPGSPESARLRALRPVLEQRQILLQTIRAFFVERHFLEVETPVWVRAPALETHIDAVPADKGFLRTSPELHMKRLVAAGYDRIFQLGPCFRHGEHGHLHHPEYTMLEWYRSRADYQDIMADTKALIVACARALTGTTDITYQGTSLALWPEWEWITVDEAFKQHAGWSPVKSYNEDRFNRDLVERIEPALARDRPVILADYPLEAGALARAKPDQPGVAERWELYIGGLELANAYSELTDAKEQRRRFEACAKQRGAMDNPVYPVDQEFMEALEHGMPPSGGIALGVDRLLMLFTDAFSLDEVLAFREDPDG